MKRIIRFAAMGLACLILLVGIIHAGIVVSNNARNQRTVIAGQHIGSHSATATNLDSRGRIMITTAVADRPEATRWRYIQVSHDHVERITPRQRDRRAIRRDQLALNNWDIANPRPGDASADWNNTNAQNRAVAEAALASSRSSFRVSNTNVNMQGVQLFFISYMTPFAMLAIAVAVFMINKGKKDKKDE